jgi:hypothetical protein
MSSALFDMAETMGGQPISSDEYQTLDVITFQDVPGRRRKRYRKERR